MAVIERDEIERVAIAIYEARVHTAIIHGWNAEPEALRERFRRAAARALAASGAVEVLGRIAALRDGKPVLDQVGMYQEAAHFLDHLARGQ
jgi:hypothetical protein